jgi:hypothetical protein
MPLAPSKLKLIAFRPRKRSDAPPVPEIVVIELAGRVPQATCKRTALGDR